MRCLIALLAMVCVLAGEVTGVQARDGAVEEAHARDDRGHGPLSGKQQSSAALVGRIETFVTQEMARQKVPGVAIAVVRGGEPVLVRGFGHGNVEWSAPVTPRTVFQSGSVGKQFTAAAVMLQVEDGKLALDDPLTRFFPDAPAHWGGITVRHLLTHTSGIPDWEYKGVIDLRRDYSEEELARLAYALPPRFEPGAQWEYSNTGYVLLGIIVRRVSGEFYGDVLAKRVFKPLGMEQARIIDEAAIVVERAGGYRLVDGELRNQEWVAPQMNTTADGSLYLTLEDMLAWDRGLRAGKVLSADSWRAVYTPVRLNDGSSFPYGFGWSVDTAAGAARHHHTGSWQGFQTAIVRYLGADLTIVVLANLAGSSPARFADGIARLLDPALAEPPVEDS